MLKLTVLPGFASRLRKASGPGPVDEPVAKAAVPAKRSPAIAEVEWAFIAAPYNH